MLAPAFRRVWDGLRHGRTTEPSLPPTLIVSRMLEGGRVLAVGEAVAVVMALGELAKWRDADGGALPSFDGVGFDWSGRLLVLDEEPESGEPVRRLADFLSEATRGVSGSRAIEDMLRVVNAPRARPLSLAAFLEKLSCHAPRERRVVIATLVTRMHTDPGAGDPAEAGPSRPSSKPDPSRAAWSPRTWGTAGGLLAAGGLVLLGASLALWTSQAVRLERTSVETRDPGGRGAPIPAAGVLAPASLSAAEPPAASEPSAGAVDTVGAMLRPVMAPVEVIPPQPPPEPTTVEAAAVEASPTAPEPVRRTGRAPPETRSSHGEPVTHTKGAPPPGRAIAPTRTDDGAASPPASSSSPPVLSPLVTPSGTTTAILWTRPSPVVSVVPKQTAAFGQASTSVYSGSRSDVVPARLLRLPDGISTTSNAHPVRGTIEVVIDERGTVEQVKLVAQGDYAEIQRIARAWRRAEFAPARRAGAAVRFRTSLPVTGLAPDGR